MRRYLNTREVSEIIGVSVGTMANWRSVGTEGPAYVKAGHRVLYPEGLFYEWLDGSLRKPGAAA